MTNARPAFYLSVGADDPTFIGSPSLTLLSIGYNNVAEGTFFLSWPRGNKGCYLLGKLWAWTCWRLGEEGEKYWVNLCDTFTSNILIKFEVCWWDSKPLKLSCLHKILILSALLSHCWYRYTVNSPLSGPLFYVLLDFMDINPDSHFLLKSYEIPAILRQIYGYFTFTDVCPDYHHVLY